MDSTVYSTILGMCFLRYYGNSCKTDWIAWVSRIFPEVHYNEAQNLWRANGVERYWNKKKKNTSHKLGRKNDYDGDDDDVFSSLIYTWTVVRGEKTQTFRVYFLCLFVSDVRIFEYFPIDVCPVLRYRSRFTTAS
jgi:hypothetical protein